MVAPEPGLFTTEQGLTALLLDWQTCGQRRQSALFKGGGGKERAEGGPLRRPCVLPGLSLQRTADGLEEERTVASLRPGSGQWTPPSRHTHTCR